MSPIKKYLFATCVLPFVVAGSAYAADSSYQTNGSGYGNWNLYTSVSGDLTWLHSADGSNPGGGVNAAVGTSFLPNPWGNFRAEAEYGYHDIANSHYNTYMGNLYYDFKALPTDYIQIMPYVGLGAGDATMHLGENDASGRYSDKGNVFAYQYMVGLSFVAPYTPNVVWSLGYRGLYGNRVDGTDNAGISDTGRLHADNLELTARFQF